MKTFYKIMPLIVLATIFSLGFSSCSDDDDNNGNTDNKKYVPSLITIDPGTAGEQTLTITYDKDYRVASIVCFTPDENETQTDIFEYNTTGNLVKWTQKSSVGNVDDKDPYAITYTYKTDSIIQKDSHDTYGWAVNSANFAEKVVRYYELPEYKDETVFEYDTNKRLVKETNTSVSGTGTNIYYNSYEYDNKTGISTHVNITMWQAVLLNLNDDLYSFLLAKTNNIAKISSEEDGDVDTMTYEYDENGYPTKMTAKDADETTIWKFEYTEVK
ncbi:YD repeat-containing protein [Dysgonomonas sp. PFB1-18]|uniref:hypothetical protein n=1 Tax=unclassified Dysgonomonas TaxID=2630389 RepID=UPI00247711AD|nr:MULTISPECIES: hypothetical protein [unclassified Dysgonomonas]MDH6309690.1 YD repeat-containing protein [Dysgonomonas sp. PF1-14]MDH6339302.1 YD repeat-containing protein [Dysgonomonas sp. PF1-16]MDH6380801.1 YD repeat-containing protein [Dysgonomonas sp. PFB1-18]MDH6398297.1 YD repeat-containing protein [Dysgonomonas sp. PF1-23]